MLHSLPYRCTGMIAFVFSVIAAIIFVSSILYVFILGSTRIGVCPAFIIAKIVAIYVLEGTITSLLEGKLKASNARVSASKPFASPTQYFAPQ